MIQFFPSLLDVWTQVLVVWLMDQVPLGNKTPRPGLPRLVHCPACRGLLPYPQALDSGHVLLECFAIEGTKPELASVFLKTIQVQEFVKESEPSLRTAEDWARARRRPTPSSSRGWIQVGGNSSLCTMPFMPFALSPFGNAIPS